MARASDSNAESRLLFTAPWEAIVVRRGDALGLRALADEFADAVAPDLSNRIQDGRWVTILAWCLVWSYKVFRSRGSRSLLTRANQRERYAWLRPLELMWIARTIAIAQEDWKGRSLAGQRCIRQWYEVDDRATDRFGMSDDQFNAYRQTGMYGGYRIAFRKWPGMTELGDGWTPITESHRLANWLDRRLGAARLANSRHPDDAEKERFSAPTARTDGKEHEWWLRQWRTFDINSRNAIDNTLPRRHDDFTLLPESNLLRPLIFGADNSGCQRLRVAKTVAKATATDHIEICEHLGRAFSSNRTFALLPRFSRLADASMDAMDLIADSLRKDINVPLATVAAQPQAAEICGRLTTAAAEWLKNPSMQLRHAETADRIARVVLKNKPVECLSSLLEYHEVYGGGLRWFVLRNGRIDPRTPPRGGSSRYRFRLWSLCRLATQCGVLSKMPAALLDDFEANSDQSSEETDE